MKLLSLLLCVCLTRVASGSPFFGSIFGSGTTTPPPPPPTPAPAKGIFGTIGSYIPGVSSLTGGSSQPAPPSPPPAEPSKGWLSYLPGSSAIANVAGGIKESVNSGPVGQVIAATNLITNAAGLGTSSLHTATSLASQGIAASTNVASNAIKGSIQMAQTGIESGKTIAGNSIGIVEAFDNIVPIKPITDKLKPVVNGAFDASSNLVGGVGELGTNTINKVNNTLSGITNVATSISGALETANQGASKVTGWLG